MPLRRECRNLGPKSAEKPAVSCVRKIGHGFPYALGSFCSFRICTKHNGLAFIGLSLRRLLNTSILHDEGPQGMPSSQMTVADLTL